MGGRHVLMARVMNEIGARLFSTVLAAGDPNPTPSGALSAPPAEIDTNSVTAGLWGFLSFAFFIIVATILYFSLRKQLRRVDFDENSPEASGIKSTDEPTSARK